MEQYGRLELLPKARDVLDQGKAFLCKDPVTQSKPKARSGRANRVAHAALEPADVERLTQLKALRMDFARQIGKPAFVVFSDATLLDMVARRPTDKASMLEVSGVGPSKYERFGEAFLAALAD
jgi:ATP-dependent DNA helicase RecQ